MAQITTITAYNLTEAAAKVGVSRVTLWRHIRDGKLIGQRRGREVLITAENLLEYVLSEQSGRGIPATPGVDSAIPTQSVGAGG